MRLVKNKIEHNGSGTVTLLPEEPEDMVILLRQSSTYYSPRINRLIRYYL